jgi:hypothetical protein
VPSRQWFSSQLFEPVMDLLTSRRAVESGRYRVDIVRRDIARHQRGEADFTDTLFAVAQFELWSERMDQTVAPDAGGGGGMPPLRRRTPGGAASRRHETVTAEPGMGVSTAQASAAKE